MSAVEHTHIKPNDIKREMLSVTSRLHATDDLTKPVLIGIGVVCAATIAGAVYVAGQRRGKTHSTIVEIRSE